ncbi:MAG: hypothetical protein RJA70_3805 [Pseudomonadota bacterium]|jgi:uncharacterized protein (TIGR01777 family)
MQTVVISGASGLIGGALSTHLQTLGWRVRRLVRHHPNRADEVRWDPEAETVDSEALEGTAAIVHLAGEPIAGYWTAAKKRAVLQSRVKGTTTLARAIAALQSPPSVWLSASAVGFYGDAGERELIESDPRGADYTSEVCVAWERAADAARERVRVVHPRIGIVLTAQGGALAKMLPAFRAGIGGKLGDGHQYMSWISLVDVVRGLHHCIQTEALCGPVNLVGPAPVTNADLTAALGRVLRRPALVSVPRFALKLAMGEFSEALLASQRALPKALLDSGFRFQHLDVESALNAALRG